MDSLGPCTCPCVRSRSRALVQRFANGKPRPCRRNLTSVTCQNVPGPPPAFPIVWEVGPGNEASVYHIIFEQTGSEIFARGTRMSVVTTFSLLYDKM